MRALSLAIAVAALGACFSRPQFIGGDGGPTDGSGDDDAGDAGECTTAEEPQEPQLQQLSLTKISAGTFHVCAIDDAMAMWCWGSNDDGQLGARTDSPGTQTGKPGLAAPTISGWTAVSASAHHSCGIADGKVYCWGRNVEHQSAPPLGGGGDVIPTEVVLPGLVFSETATKVFAGETASCAITSLNKAFCWGDVNLDGNNDTGTAPVALHSTPDPSGWQSIAIGPEHACAIDIDGHLHCWGSNSVMQLGDATATTRTFAQVALRGAAAVFTSVAVTRESTCATRAGTDLVCFGTASHGHLGPASANSADQLVLDNGTWDRVAIGPDHVCSVAGGSVFCYGDNVDGALGNGQFRKNRSIEGAVDNNVVEVTAGEAFTCARDTSNHVKCWGKNSHGELGLGVIATKRDPSTALLPMGSCESVFQVSAGDRHTCAIVGTAPDTSGRLYCWGNNSDQQVTGLTAEVSIPTPREVYPGETFSRVATGEVHTCALRSDGAIRCWGDNDAHQLGAGGTAPSLLMPVGGLPYIYVAAGSQASCAIRMGGELFCWGEVPQAGSTTGPTSFARPMNNTRNWTAVSLGSGFGVGTAIDPANPNRVYAYAFGPMCQVDSTMSYPPSNPIEVYQSNHVRANVSAAQANGGHVCIHRNDMNGDNKISCWGNNSNAQCSDELRGQTCISREDPDVPPSGWRMAFPGASTIAVARTHSCALDTVGRPWCWGSNNTAELGGLPYDNFVPAMVTDQRFAEISTGADHTCGISDDRKSLSCWGENRHGQVGDRSRFMPSPVAAGLVP